MSAHVGSLRMVGPRPVEETRYPYDVDLTNLVVRYERVRAEIIDGSGGGRGGK